MKFKFFIYMLSIALVLTIVGCGSNFDNNKTNSQQKQKVDKAVLSEDNFIALAKYHFQKQSVQLQKSKASEFQNNQKFRSFPGATKPSVENDSTLRISTVTPFNKYIESMKITAKNRYILVEVKNTLYVVISLYEDKTLLKSIKKTMHEFGSLELQNKWNTL